jgi:hypothetical protein
LYILQKVTDQSPESLEFITLFLAVYMSMVSLPALVVVAHPLFAIHVLE